MKDSTFKKYCLVIDEWCINGKNGTKAYQKFYPKSTLKSASANFEKILRITEISDYKDKKLSNKSEELNITLTLQLNRLNNIINGKGKESDIINAIKEQNKLLALYKEHNEQKTSDIKISFKD